MNEQEKYHHRCEATIDDNATRCDLPSWHLGEHQSKDKHGIRHWPKKADR